MQLKQFSKKIHKLKKKIIIIIISSSSFSLRERERERERERGGNMKVDLANRLGQSSSSHIKFRSK